MLIKGDQKNTYRIYVSFDVRVGVGFMAGELVFVDGCDGLL